MPNETRETTPSPGVPGWVTKTPNPEPLYCLQVENEGGDIAQEIILDRAEYIALKDRLAKMRGFEVPEAEPKAETPAAEKIETAPVKATEAEEESITERLIGSLIDCTVRDLRYKRKFIADNRATWDASDWSEFQADAAILRDIMADWIGDGFQADFPKETKLIGTIRFHLDL